MVRKQPKKSAISHDEMQKSKDKQKQKAVSKKSKKGKK